MDDVEEERHNDDYVYKLMYRLAYAVADRLYHTSEVDIGAYCGIYEVRISVRRQT